MFILAALGLLAGTAVVDQPVISASVLGVRERYSSGGRYHRYSVQFRNESGAVQEFKTCPNNAVYVYRGYPPENTMPISGAEPAFAISEGTSDKFGIECIERSLAAGEAIRVNVFVRSVGVFRARDSLVVATSLGDVRFRQPEGFQYS